MTTTPGAVTSVPDRDATDPGATGTDPAFRAHAGHGAALSTIEHCPYCPPLCDELCQNARTADPAAFASQIAAHLARWFPAGDAPHRQVDPR